MGVMKGNARINYSSHRGPFRVKGVYRGFRGVSL